MSANSSIKSTALTRSMPGWVCQHTNSRHSSARHIDQRVCTGTLHHFAFVPALTTEFDSDILLSCHAQM